MKSDRLSSARRRPRSNDDSEYWGVHCMIADELPPHIEFETNRLRFIGRGRTLASPLALQPGAKLSGDSGAVLDPIASLRLAVAIEPGESQEVAFLLGTGPDRAVIEELLRSVAEMADVRKALNEANTVGLSNGHPAVAIRPDYANSAAREEKHRPALAEDFHDLPVTNKQPELVFDNGYGGFTADGREYVIGVTYDGEGGQRRPPLPWVNIIANEQAGFLVSESGAGYTWAGNSRNNRLTAWHNDPVCDPHAEALWIRDDEAGVFWSPTPGPTGADGNYEVRHGFGYSVFDHESQGLRQELTMFMVRDDPVKVARLRIENRSDRSRRLSVFSYEHWSLGGLASETTIDVTTTHRGTERAIFATNPHREHYGEHVAFSAPVIDETHHSVISCTGDRAAFIGRYRDLSAPAAVVSSDELDGQTGEGIDPCAAWKISFKLPPGETFECAFLLGETASNEAARKLVAKYGFVSSVREALAESQRFWQEMLSAIVIETPIRELDFLINGWLAYQNLSCRMWARSAYYQPGGAFGFRDQLQDSAALVYHRPEITRAKFCATPGDSLSKATCCIGGTPIPSMACGRVSQMTCYGCRY